MKKGLINIIIVILSLTNIILSAIIVFAVVPAMNSTSDLVNKVAEAINLEKEGNNDVSELTIEDIDTFTFTDSLLVSLKAGEDGKAHYASFKLTLTLNKSDEAYGKYVETLKTSEELMKSKINAIVSKYTKFEVENNQQAILDEIVKELRALFNNTTFIYNAGWSEFVTQ